ncbi:MAG: nitroreductase family protein [Candidatus Odinarchaeum yellowstonii]|uniref:Nitroreductase family protein n=1 Tax=Odinarchaeota yellowstonii (strain LCB_4) TaxID=1841599 RepID=A0AAF0D1S9_ODILC|nr:MAG: nitroreductase family protein [Candidatus Odinarchaeum yellowstonii]
MGLKNALKQFQKLIHSRRSIRVFQKREVPCEKILKILEYGVWAPSAHNCQPWRFIVILNKEVRDRLVEEMSILYEADMRKDGLQLEEIESRLSKSKLMLKESPVLILACLDRKVLWRYNDRSRDENEFIMGVQSVAASIQNILLGAHAEGLGACWMCAPLFCKNIVRSVLKLSEDYEPQAFIILGYPAENPTPPYRRSVNELTVILD